MQCTRCGSEIPAHSRFCLSCGLPVQAGNVTQQGRAAAPRAAPPPYAAPPAAPAYPSAAPYPPASARRPIWPLVACVVVLLLLVGSIAAVKVLHSPLAVGAPK